MASDCWDISAEDEANLSIDELYERHLSSQSAFDFSEDLYETPDYPSENGAYYNSYDLNCYQEEFTDLTAPSIHNQFQDNEESIQRWEFDELKEDVKSLQVSLVRLAKFFECQENIPSREEEYPTEPVIKTHTIDEGEQNTVEFSIPIGEPDETWFLDELFTHQFYSEENCEFAPKLLKEEIPIQCPDKKTCVPQIVVLVEPNISEVKEEKILVTIEDAENEFASEKLNMEMDLGDNSTPGERVNQRKHPRDHSEETKSKRSRTHRVGRQFRQIQIYTFDKVPRMTQEHCPDSMPFDPGGGILESS